MKNDKDTVSEFDSLISSRSLQKRLLKARDVDDYLEENKQAMLPERFSEYLNKLLYEKNVEIAEVIRRSQLDKAYAYQIFSGKKSNPSRDKLIAIAFGLDLNLEETRKMLKASGNRELYVRDIRDSVIIFALNNHKNIIETNEMLYNKGLKIID